MDQVLARVAEATRELERKDTARAQGLDAARSVTSGARTIMNLVHRGELDAARARYDDFLGQARGLRATVAGHLDLWHGGAVLGALQEVAEAWALLRLSGVDVEHPGDVLTPEATVLGVADCVGELRRLALDALIAERPGEARARLSEMETLYDVLRAIDVARAVVEIKHKVDVARQLVDRTRGEVALGILGERLTRRT